MKILAVCIFALIVVATSQDAQTYEPSLTGCSFSGLNFYDLSTLSRSNGQTAYNVYDSVSGLSWNFNLCGGVSGLTMEDGSPLVECGETSAVCAVNVTAVVQVPSTPPTNVLTKVEIKQYTNAGNVLPEFYEYDSGIGLWYSGDQCSTGDNFTSFLFINCDPLSTFTVVSVDTSYACYAQIIANSSLGCPSVNEIPLRRFVACKRSLLFTAGICFGIVTILCCCVACCCARRRQRNCKNSNATVSFQPLPQEEIVTQAQPVNPTAPVAMNPTQFMQIPQYYYYPMQQPQFVQPPMAQPVVNNFQVQDVQIDADEKLAIELQSRFDREV